MPIQCGPDPSASRASEVDDDAAEIARLAALPPVAYGRERKVAAKQLGCTVEILDRAVKGERGNGGNDARQGRALDLHEPAAAPESVA